MKRCPKSEAGFTLLELIVALAISSLVAMMGAAAMSTTLDFYQRNAHRSAAREDVRAIERTLRHEWATRGTTVRSDGSMLQFNTLHPVARRALPDLTLAQVQYACETTPNEGLVLIHRISVPPAKGPNSVQRNQSPMHEETRILATRLEACAFSFLGSALGPGGQPQPRWIASWDEKTPAPELMRLVLSGVRADMPPVVYQARTGARSR